MTTAPEPSFTIGVEEEYLLVDRESRDLVPDPPAGLMADCQKALGGQVSPEFLRCQIEVETSVCQTVAEARAEIARLRRTIAKCAAEYGLAPIAASTHPFAEWSLQRSTDKERYNVLARDMQVLARRLLICGMHVHVGIEDEVLRFDLLNQVAYFLPHLLALSTSSPFWQGHLTGLVGYRLAAYDELPRTGLPEPFRTKEDYDEFVAALTWAKIIPDASYIRWGLRPSLGNPTVELRVADSCTRLDDAVAIAALFRCLVRALDRDRALNAGFDRVGRAITAENKWHAQRYGIAATFVDPFSRSPLTLKQWLDQVFDFIAEDIEAFGCAADLRRLHRILAEGTSADRQIDLFTKARAAGRQRLTAIKEVIDWAAAETTTF
jgi:carboxylate-amine ligase